MAKNDTVDTTPAPAARYTVVEANGEWVILDGTTGDAVGTSGSLEGAQTTADSMNYQDAANAKPE